jgi:hypothetical protein
MSTIQELIDNGKCVLGKTKIVNQRFEEGRWFIPYFIAGYGAACYGDNNCGNAYKYHPGKTDLDWQVYVEPVEMEDRWLWAQPGGYVTGHMYTEGPSFHGSKFSIKLEGTKAQFPKEKK